MHNGEVMFMLPVLKPILNLDKTFYGSALMKVAV
jgi:hypothetical protein